MPLTEASKTTLAVGSAIGSVFLAITILEYFPFRLTDYGSALTLVITSTILIFESVYEESLRKRIPMIDVLKEWEYPNLVFLILAGTGYILAIILVFNLTIPVEIRGLAALIICMHALGVVIERFRP